MFLTHFFLVRLGPEVFRCFSFRALNRQQIFVWPACITVQGEATMLHWNIWYSVSRLRCLSPYAV